MQNTDKSTFTELVETFGRKDIADIAREKIREYEQPGSARFTPAQRNYLVYRMGPTDAVRAIDLGEALKQSKRRETLAYWCKLFLKVADKPSIRIDNFTDAQIQQAREYPTHELYEGQLIKSGVTFRGRCFFHNEKTASLFFYRDGHYHCFGCGTHGSNAIDYLMNLEKSSFEDSVKRLI